MMRFYEYCMSKGESVFLSQINTFLTDVVQMEICPQEKFIFFICRIEVNKLKIFEILDFRKFAIVKEIKTVRMKCKKFEFIGYREKSMEILMLKNWNVSVLNFDLSGKKIEETFSIPLKVSSSGVFKLGHQFIVST